MTEKEKSILLRETAKTKGGALLIDMISEAALRRMTGDPIKIQQQSGVFNLWLDLNDYLTGELK
jgi:hypothetical protein